MDQEPFGVTGNEAADNRAKDVISTSVTVKDGISNQDIKKIFNSKIYKEWSGFKS